MLSALLVLFVVTDPFSFIPGAAVAVGCRCTAFQVGGFGRMMGLSGEGSCRVWAGTAATQCVVAYARVMLISFLFAALLLLS